MWKPERRKKRNRGSQLQEPQQKVRCGQCVHLVSQALRLSRINLFVKYCSSLNFYFIKDINDYLDGTSTPTSILLKDRLLLYDYRQLLQSYVSKKSTVKMQLAKYCEYYKYYNNSPQFFMRPAEKILKTYENKKKMLIYRRIVAKEQSDDMRSTNNHESSHRVLDRLSPTISKKSHKKLPRKNKPHQNINNSFEQISNLKVKLARAIRIYENKVDVVKLEIAQSHPSEAKFELDHVQLSAIKNADPEGQFDCYGLNNLKQGHIKKKRKVKKSQLIAGQSKKQSERRSISKAVSRDGSSFRSTMRLKHQKPGSVIKCHRRTKSSESNIISAGLHHKYTPSYRS